MYQRAISAYDKPATQGDMTRQINHLTELADSYQKQGIYKEAEALYKRLIAIQTKMHKTSYDEHAEALFAYAELLRHTDRASDAARMEYLGQNLKRKAQITATKA